MFEKFADILEICCIFFNYYIKI